jgi:probable HAF family extracellular repeat protein
MRENNTANTRVIRIGVFIFALTVVSFLGCGLRSAEASSYTVTDLEGGYSAALSINDAGAVVGYNQFGGVIWNSDGTRTILGPDSSATGINNSGQVVGRIGTSLVSWNGTTPNVLYNGPTFTQATGINSAGQIIGVASSQALIFNGTTPTVLGNLLPSGGRSYAAAVNDAGQVAGNSLAFNPSFPYFAYSHAVVWNGTVPTDLGTIGTPFTNSASSAAGINNLGQVVGSATVDSYGTPHAVLWNGTTPTD